MASESIEARVLQVLDGLDHPYETLEIDPQFADTAEFCERYGVGLEESANTIVVASRKEPKRYSACVIQASARLDVNRCVRKLMGVRRLSFAGGDETKELTGMMIGGVTVFALPEGFPIYVDGNLMRQEFVILGGGGRSSKIKIAPTIFERLPGAQIVPDLAQGSTAVE